MKNTVIEYMNYTPSASRRIPTSFSTYSEYGQSTPYARIGAEEWGRRYIRWGAKIVGYSRSETM